MSSVAEHYGLPRLLDTILNALRAQGKDTDHLAVDDLAAVDEFHIRGREATLELAKMACNRADEPWFNTEGFGFTRGMLR